MASSSASVGNIESDSKSSPIEHLVFQGGGVKGIAYYGAVSALLKASDKKLNFDFSKISSVGGTSAGALTALALALGLNQDELKIFLVQTDIVQYLDDSQSKVKKKTFLGFSKSESKVKKLKSASANASDLVSDLRRQYGIFSTEKIRVDLLEPLIRRSLPSGDTRQHLTFEELRNLTKVKSSKYKDLKIVGYNLTRKRAVVLSADTTPNAIISDAVIISMCIPFVFKPHSLYIKKTNPSVTDQNQWRVLPDGVSRNDLWIDGGIVDNYPITLFDADRSYNLKTLGFSFYSKPTAAEAHERDTRTNSTAEEEREGVLKFAVDIIDAVLNGQQLHSHYLGRDHERTVYIDTKGVSALALDLNLEEKNTLIESGWNCTCEWLLSLSPNYEASETNSSSLKITEITKTFGPYPQVSSEELLSTEEPTLSSNEANSNIDVDMAFPAPIADPTSVPPTTMTSRVDPSISISSSQWAVSLLCVKPKASVISLFKRSREEHACLFIEGVNETGEYVCNRADLFNDNTSEPHASSSHNPVFGAAKVKLQADVVVEEFLKKYDNEFKHIWGISADQAKQINASIEREVQKDIKYSKSGHQNSSLSPANAQNCVTWCLEILKEHDLIGWNFYYKNVGIKRPSSVLKKIKVGVKKRND